MGARRYWKTSYKSFSGISLIVAALWRLLTFDESRLLDNLAQSEEVRVKYEKLDKTCCCFLCVQVEIVSLYRN